MIRVADVVLEVDCRWHTYEPEADTGASTTAYISCFTEDGRYQDFLIKNVVRTFTSRAPTGVPSLGTLMLSFKVACCRGDPSWAVGASPCQ
jgi:hypothetical protein